MQAPPKTGSDALAAARRVVIKIGSSTLVDNDGSLREAWLRSLVADVAALKAAGKQVILVSSGAIALGKKWLDLTARPKRLDDAQAAAAIGQIKLARAFEDCFAATGHTVAQLLLTLDDLEDRARYLNARGTMEALLKRGIIPLINENDTVATTEIRFGDNDRLAARSAQLAGADLLCLLSDIDGLYTMDPNEHAGAAHIPLIEEIDRDILTAAGPSSTTYGTGGMTTKIAAAQIAMSVGCSVTISKGFAASPLARLQSGDLHTLFISKTKPLDARRGWIKGLKAPAGSLRLDDGAILALEEGKSLLAVGVQASSGTYQRGDLLTLIAANERIIGQGLTNYSSEEVQKIAGKKAKDIEDILGYAGRAAIIHRDDLVLD